MTVAVDASLKEATRKPKSHLHLAVPLSIPLSQRQQLPYLRISLVRYRIITVHFQSLAINISSRSSTGSRWQASSPGMARCWKLRECEATVLQKSSQSLQYAAKMPACEFIQPRGRIVAAMTSIASTVQSDEALNAAPRPTNAIQSCYYTHVLHTPCRIAQIHSPL